MVKNIVFAAEIIAALFFFIPMLSGIINPGNMAGLIFIILLFAATLKSHLLFTFISEVWSRSFGKPLIICASTIILVIIVYILSITVLIVSASVGKPDNPQAVIVLGCKVIDDRPSKMLRRRLDAAVDYLNENNDVMCIVSGGKGDDEKYSEAFVMKKYLVEKGISADRIISEDKSVNTSENIKNSLELSGISSGEIVLITDGFHQYRSGYIAKRYGVRASAVNAKTSLNGLLLTPTYYVRELMAISKELLVH